jgi:transposase
MRKKIPEITASVETLKERLKQEKHARIKLRLHMLYCLKSGKATTRTEVAALLAVHRHTIGHWLACYETAGLERLLEIKTYPNRAYFLTAQMVTQLKERLQAPVGFRSDKEVGVWLKNQLGDITFGYRGKAVNQILTIFILAYFQILIWRGGVSYETPA